VTTALDDFDLPLEPLGHSLPNVEHETWEPDGGAVSAREIQPKPASEWEPEPNGTIYSDVHVIQAAAPAARSHTPTMTRYVLISGGDRGIGAATARAFYAAGYRVAILYHSNEAAARALLKELPGCIAVQCDVSDRASCDAAFRAVEQTLGRVDVLVCNAGIAQQKLFTDITPAEWQRMLDVNLTGAFNLCQLALPGMIRRRWGRILTVSSMWGQIGGSCEVHYSAAKAGLIGLTKALAKEEGPSGVTANCVAPGVIETDMMASFSAEDKAALAEETPTGRLGTPEEVAAMLVYLAGENAGFITGQVFGVNGGLVI
jgi:3-oxoacyl-[acyl-carrier protein] reductase